MVSASRERIDLSGQWYLAFDPDGEGISKGWMGQSWPEARAERVDVPAIWNVTHPDSEGVGFYRKVFIIPSDWQGRIVQLHFGGVSYRAEVWLNGVFVGSHEGAYTPFEFDVTSMVKVDSENSLVVRVAALSKNKNVDGMALWESPASKQDWYYTHGGLWGEIYLEALPFLSCRNVVVEPDLNREIVLIEVTVSNNYIESHPLDLNLQIADPDGVLAVQKKSRVSVPPGTPRFTYRMPLPRPRVWNCQDPNLYRLQVGISEHGQEVDSRIIPFGMRDFTVHDGQFFLNGEPIFLRGVLLQPNYPVTLLTPPSRDMMVKEITLAKEAGFNLIRVHIRPAPPGYLDLTDKLGMLVYAESSLAWIKDSPRLLDHGRREIQAMIERDRNHPSVVFWGIHNENRAANTLTSDALIRFVRGLDPTRVIVDNSGGTMAIDQDFGWIDRASVVPSRQTERQRIQDMHIYAGAFIPPPVYEWMRTLGVSDLSFDMSAQDFGSKAILDELNRELRSYRGKVFVSELGCGGMADLDKVVAGYQNLEHLKDAREMKAFRDSLYQGFTTRRLDQIFGSVRDLIQATQMLQAQGLTRQIEALMVNPRISGYIVTQLNDVAWEFHAGILDPWRNPKPVYDALKRLNHSHCLVLKAVVPVVTCGDQIEVNLTLINQRPLHGTEQLLVTIRDPMGKETKTTQGAIPTGVGIQELGNISVETGPGSGEYRVSVQLVGGQKTLAESTEIVLALPSVDLAKVTGQVKFYGEIPRIFESEEREITNDRYVSDKLGGNSEILLVAYPASLTENDWDNLLDMVDMGQVAIIGPMHKRDEIALRVLNKRGVKMRLHLGIGNWMGCYHWMADSDLFAGLPANRIASEAYVDVLPWYVMSELGGEVFAGSLRNTQTRREAPAILWYSDIEAMRFGRGTVLFCQYRLFGQEDSNPLAARLVSNLIRLVEGF